MSPIAITPPPPPEPPRDVPELARLRRMLQGLLHRPGRITKRDIRRILDQTKEHLT